jgi:hypothetical protein
MNTIIKKSTLVFLICLTFSCSSNQVFTLHTNRTDLSNYKTYSCLSKEDSLKRFYPQNKIIQDHVNKFIDEEMRKRKLVRAEKADLMIAFHTIEKKDTLVFFNLIFSDGTSELIPPDSYNPRNFPRYIGTNTQEYKYTRRGTRYRVNPDRSECTERPVKYKPVEIKYLEGALVIDLIDTKNNLLLWRGWSVDTLCEGYSIDPKTYENKIEYHLKSNIHKILSRSPLPKH